MEDLGVCEWKTLIDLKQTRLVDVNCIKLTQGTIKWRTGVSAIVDLRFLLNVENFLCNRIAIGEIL